MAESDALTGTTGAPDGVNRFVTEQDTRLVDQREPSSHGHDYAEVGHEHESGPHQHDYAETEHEHPHTHDLPAHGHDYAASGHGHQLEAHTHPQVDVTNL